MLSNVCPLPSSLVSIPETDCPISFDQIAKIGFQKIQSAASFTKTTIALKATWTPLLAADDDTKIVLSPLVLNLVIPASELISEGGNDNTTINGIKNVKGLGSVSPTGQILNISSATKVAIQKLFPFTKAPCPGSTLLWAYFITSDGRVIFRNTGEGFPIYNLTLSDPGSEGYRQDNKHNLAFDLAGGWSDGMDIVSSDINVITFKNPA